MTGITTGIVRGLRLLVLLAPIALATGCGEQAGDVGVAGCGCGCGCYDAGCGCGCAGCGCGGGEQAEIDEALAGLSADDRALAEEQEICPVSGQPLGSMGTPIKLTVKDRTVFLCCESCRKKIMAEPDKYLAILDAD